MSEQFELAKTVAREALENPAVRRATENAVGAAERMLADITPAPLKAMVADAEKAIGEAVSGADGSGQRFIAPWNRAFNSRGEVVTRSESAFERMELAGAKAAAAPDVVASKTAFEPAVRAAGQERFIAPWNRATNSQGQIVTRSEAAFEKIERH